MQKLNSEQLAWLIRRHSVEMTHLSHGSHIGAALSVSDIIAVLYADIMAFDPNNPKSELRDRIILSKGHAGAAIYAALAEEGFFSVEELKTHYANGSRLSGHVSHHVPGVDFSTGSLGHGLSVGAGMALALKKDKKKQHVFVVLGDGECDEGSVWEAAMFANHYQLGNLIAIVDHNKMQSLDFCENTIKLGNLAEKWASFGWRVVEINGNDHQELRNALQTIKNQNDDTNKQATVIIANTIKGYGIEFMQNDILWHYRFPHDGWEYDCAVTELHDNMPEGIIDVYTPKGIATPMKPNETSDIYNDHTLSYTWTPTYFSTGERVQGDLKGKTK